MKVLRAATAAWLILATAAVAQAPARGLNLSREERTAITALQTAAASPDRAAQDGALASARTAARGVDARYAIAHYQLEIGRARGDYQMVNQAVDALVDSGLATAEELPSLLANQAARAFSANRAMIVSADSERSPRGARLISMRPLLRVELVPSTPMNEEMLRTAGSSSIRAASACWRSGPCSPRWH